MVDPVVASSGEFPDNRGPLPSGSFTPGGQNFPQPESSAWKAFCCRADAEYQAAGELQPEESSAAFRRGLCKERAAFEAAKAEFSAAPEKLLQACKRIIEAFAATGQLERALEYWSESKTLLPGWPLAQIELGGVFVRHYQPNVAETLRGVLQEVIAAGSVDGSEDPLRTQDLTAQVVIPAMGCLACEVAQDLSPEAIQKLGEWCRRVDAAGLTEEEAGMLVSYAHARQLVYAGRLGTEDAPNDAVVRLEAIQAQLEDEPPTELLGSVYDTLGRAYHLQHRWSEATSAFEKAIDTFSSEALQAPTDRLISPVCGLIALSDLTISEEYWTEMRERLVALCSAEGTSWDRLLGRFTIATLDVFEAVRSKNTAARTDTFRNFTACLGALLGAFGPRHYEVHCGLRHLAFLCPGEAANTLNLIFSGDGAVDDVRVLGLSDQDRAIAFVQLGKYLEEIAAITTAIDAYRLACSNLDSTSTVPCSRNGLRLHLGQLLESMDRFPEAQELYSETLDCGLSDNLAHFLSFRFAAARVALICKQYSAAVAHLTEASSVMADISEPPIEIVSAHLECISWLGFAKHRDGEDGEAAVAVAIRALQRTNPEWAREFIAETNGRLPEYQTTRFMAFLSKQLRDDVLRLRILSIL